MKKKLTLILFAGLVSICQAQTTNKPAAAMDKMDWWKDAKFGMFIHWGVYSVPAGIYQGQQVKGIGEWIMNTAKIPVAVYQLYAKEFNPVKYDPEAWVRMAKNAGMKYIVITSKHHDGFALFDSKVTDWDVVDASPYGKDLLKPLVAACHKEGIKIGFYYSQAQDWHHPGGAASGGHWDKDQEGDFDAYLDKIALPQVKEILSNYGGLDIVWWDTPQNMTAERAQKFLELTGEYPNLIMNNRLGGGYNGDTETPEQFVPATGFPGRNWESCMTMNDTWGYKSDDNNWKSSKMLIQQLVDVVSKGGNMLLNVGPTSLGEIPLASIERLDTIGKWIKTNHESLYGTAASPFPYLSWGRCTRKKQKLFLHIFDYPANGVLAVPVSNKIHEVYFLAEPAKRLHFTAVNGRVLIRLPSKVLDTVNTVVVMKFEGSPSVAPSPVTGKKIIASSQKEESTRPENLLDGDRQTRWEAAKGEREASLEINLLKPVIISTIIADEPWHPWENKKQQFILQYKSGDKWIAIIEGESSGSGYIKNFKPVKAQYFRLLVSNNNAAPVLLEWQLYGPE
ncbi:MAG: alpha-L-fucosidase [Bacteroidota bacterium]